MADKETIARIAKDIWIRNGRPSDQDEHIWELARQEAELEEIRQKYRKLKQFSSIPFNSMS